MALFTDQLIDETITLVNERQREVALALGQTVAAEVPTTVNTDAPLYQQLVLLLRVANGELTRGAASKEETQAVASALAAVQSLLLGNPLGAKTTWPADFWQRDLGVLVSRVRWWLSADELITISNAAALAFGENNQANRMRIVRAIESNLLDWVPDPSVSNPQQNRRVLRWQVERLGAQRRLPE